MSRKMEDLKEMICKELDEIAEKGELSAGDLDTIYKLIISKEKLLRIEEIEGDMGYSEDGDWRAEGSYNRGSSYRDSSYRSMRGNSYANRGKHYVRGHYSYADDIKSRLREMMESGELTASQRNAMQRAMDEM